MINFELEDAIKILNRLHPCAVATISGRDEYNQIRGKALFYNVGDGCVVITHIRNLPQTNANFFGFHIHENRECSGDYTSAGRHLGSGTHPTHIGDMPPLLNANGTAFLAFFTTRFNCSDIVGKSVIIHLAPDDFTTQPSGNSGKRIACGIITNPAQ